jgi:ubiquinone/menaquinone biosynthesis C-methylase UbiE
MEYYKKIGMYYDKDACNYDSRYWNNPVVQQMRQSFREQVKQFPAKSMLEIGFGTGLDLVHFGKIHPDRLICGIDLSAEMLKLTRERIISSKCNNIEIFQGSVEDIGILFPNYRFDVIYVFFGALNTVKDLNLAADKLKTVLNRDGVIIVTYINKWYLGGMLIEMIRCRFLKVFSRLKTTWGGYSPSQFLPSRCYTPGQVKEAFSGMKVIQNKGYTIVHPAWFYTKINSKLGERYRRILWSVDTILSKTFLWRWGEYGLVVFKTR